MALVHVGVSCLVASLVEEVPVELAVTRVPLALQVFLVEVAPRLRAHQRLVLLPLQVRVQAAVFLLAQMTAQSP